MKLRPAILLFEPQPVEARYGHRIAALQPYGFDIAPCADMQELSLRAQDHAAQAAASWLAVLAGSQADNCLAASYLRTLYPRAGILALVATFNETLLTQVLQSGADNYCRRNASARLLLATVLRLLRWVGNLDTLADACASPAQQATPGHWQLLERGWALAGPQQQRIPLTTGERAFLTTLFAAPDFRAGHQALMAAVNSSYEPIASSGHPARLGLLVSRLRRKFRAHGTGVPLKSIHSWGYMFIGPVIRETARGDG